MPVRNEDGLGHPMNGMFPMLRKERSILRFQSYCAEQSSGSSHWKPRLKCFDPFDGDFTKHRSRHVQQNMEQVMDFSVPLGNVGQVHIVHKMNGWSVIRAKSL